MAKQTLTTVYSSMKFPNEGGKTNDEHVKESKTRGDSKSFVSGTEKNQVEKNK